LLSQFFAPFWPCSAPSFAGRSGGPRPERPRLCVGAVVLCLAAMQTARWLGAGYSRPRRTAAKACCDGGWGRAALLRWQRSRCISIGDVLIGIGCAPVLMAPTILSRLLNLRRAVLSCWRLSCGVGHSGPRWRPIQLAIAAETIGWRAALCGAFAPSTTLTAIAHLCVVCRPPPPPKEATWQPAWRL